MKTVRIYHNPRCSKSRQTLALLQDRGIEPEIIEYLKTPPSADELLQLARQLSLPLAKLLRTKEPQYQEYVADRALADGELAAIMSQHPKLIERPIVVHGQRAALGRPPEQVLSLFHD